MTSFKKLIALALISSAVVFSSCDKDDDDNTVSGTGALSGNQEVPVRATAATGNYTVSYNKDNKKLDFTLTWAGLTTNPTISHIHGPAAKGVNAGIKYDYSASFPKTAAGTYTGSTTIDGVAIKEDSLLAGFYYFNIHTPTYPGGEIRGQIEFQ